MGLISHHVTLLVIDSLGGGPTQPHMHTNFRRSNFKKPGSHFGQHVYVLIIGSDP